MVKYVARHCMCRTLAVHYSVNKRVRHTRDNKPCSKRPHTTYSAQQAAPQTKAGDIPGATANKGVRHTRDNKLRRKQRRATYPGTTNGSPQSTPLFLKVGEGFGERAKTFFLVKKSFRPFPDSQNLTPPSPTSKQNRGGFLRRSICRGGFRLWLGLL